MGGKIMGVVGAVIITVIALVLAPLILDQANNVITHTAISSFPGTEALAKLVPLMYIVGVLGLAGAFAWVQFKRGEGAAPRRRR